MKDNIEGKFVELSATQKVIKTDNQIYVKGCFTDAVYFDAKFG